ncbi:MAG TPA: Rap1a/Tai family immunity protein [Gammaproteobacteria bacterium]
MNIRFATALIGAAFLFALPPARAIEWIPTRDVKSVCQQFLTKPNSPSGYMCVSYIQGFLDGIKATEPARYSPTGSHSDDDTRYSLQLAGVCLPSEVGVNQILRVVARGIANASVEPRDPETSAIRALRTSYGCEDVARETDHPDADIPAGIEISDEGENRHEDDRGKQ